MSEIKFFQMFRFEGGGVFWRYQRCSNLIISSPYFYPVEDYKKLFGSYFVINLQMEI